MKLSFLILPVMILIACIMLLAAMDKMSMPGGDWGQMDAWLILLIPSLIGIILGVGYLFRRR